MIAMTAPRPTPPSTSQLFNLPSSPSSAFFSPTPTVRKRRAASPTTPPSPSAAYKPSSPWSFDSSPIPAKRRRPNLAHGFSTLSIDPSISGQPGTISLPSYQESQDEASRKDVDDDDGDSLDTHNDNDVNSTSNDINVEDISSPRKRHHRPPFGVSRGSSSSVSTSGYDSDTTFSLPKIKRRGTQQADEVEQPYEPFLTGSGQDVSVEDITPRIGAKRRSSSVSDGPKGKRMREGMDLDMDMDTMGYEDVEEIIRDEDRGRRRSKWHEPEKDRIIYTSLGSSPSGSPTSSRARSDSPPAQLSQPGENGFTISPSMLTRLLAAQKDTSIPLPFDFNPNPPGHQERGLILYRPMGIPPGIDRKQAEEILRQWQGSSAATGQNGADSGRFEVVDDDEDLQLDEPASNNYIEEINGTSGDMDVDM